MTWNAAQGLEYTHVGTAFVTPSTDAASQNLAGVRYVQATTAGALVFRLVGGGLTVAVPIFAGEALRIGRLMVAVYSFTGTNLIPYYDTEL